MGGWGVGTGCYDSSDVRFHAEETCGLRIADSADSDTACVTV